MQTQPISPQQAPAAQPASTHLSRLSFILGLLSAISPLLAFYFLIARNGGAGYVQSLFCGVPLAFASLLAGIISLALPRPSAQSGVWMAISGIAFGALFFLIACLLALVLLGPFLTGTAG